MEYEVLIKDDGKVIDSFQGNTLNSAEIKTSDLKIPRVFAVPKENNKEMYDQLLNCNEKTLRVESDSIEGLFKVKVNDKEIIFEEVFE